MPQSCSETFVSTWEFTLLAICCSLCALVRLSLSAVVLTDLRSNLSSRDFLARCSLLRKFYSTVPQSHFKSINSKNVTNVPRKTEPSVILRKKLPHPFTSLRKMVQYKFGFLSGIFSEAQKLGKGSLTDVFLNRKVDIVGRSRRLGGFALSTDFIFRLVECEEYSL
ncbi:hypothetical protein AVEN_51446-1 [Araneus ventricosus]|uniref:Uncharacterized protein n=1 Tax=Araneus ventricosus TaxID=182803 RepID=A0A4Y2KF29_ARAVE|nr:hypothetical protein AVEN_51446-1 [Araneus ventricosus]